MRSVIVVGLVFLAGCASRVPPGTSVEGATAVYAERALDVLRQAQTQIIALGDAEPSLRPTLTPAIERMGIAFKAGETLAVSLRVLDQSGLTEPNRATALTTVRTAVDTLDAAMRNILLNVDSQTARDRITRILDSLQVGRTLIVLWSAIGPYLPAPPPAMEAAYGYQ